MVTQLITKELLHYTLLRQDKEQFNQSKYI